MASIAGSLYLDIREGRKITFGGNPETFLKIEKVDYKNNAFEVYTQTFVGYQENKCDWRKSKHVSKPINPPNLSISEFDFKTIDTRDFFKSDPLIQIIIVYSKDAKDKNDAALVIGFVTKSGVKKYYVVSEIYAKNYMVKMSSLRHIDESHLLDELCKENYTKNNVLTIKIDTKNSYHNVDVKNENVKPTEFQKYNHTVKSSDSRHVKSAVDCDSKCEFTGFKPEEYTKLGEVDVYFHESDSNQRVPLLVEFKPLSGQQLGGNGKDKKVQYQLKTIKKEEDDDKPKEWTKTYEKGLSETVDKILKPMMKYPNVKQISPYLGV
ncbi:hypothetical protein MACK_001116 [Theileria orientalis]|uniref:Uncharacterized protein n=1 Tax=Theileria orientalis TaxID=68886 RepID=A0A976MC95_THEOR|nr:hypothetical protein MACK_001116 [Theileria orientalis]